MQALFSPLMGLAIAGFVASLVVHVVALMGQPSPLGQATWLLHVGIFVVWFPTVLVAQKLSRGAKQVDFWKATLRGCPIWVKRGAYLVFGYAFVNFFLFLMQASEFPRNQTPEPIQYRGFSGHWMAFYYVAAATLYSAAQVGSLRPRACPLGHEVSPFASYCETCGAPVPPAALT